MLHDVMDGDDARVAERDRGAGFADEPPDQLGAVGVVRARREKDLLTDFGASG
ncbi:hypothetical protein [Streptomyces sp. NPDC051704]|uniref:hypothetical protein n=1 Tax=Streptomyces sp. NPDC051704 TaxID=3365671 RepID=UPI003791D820